MLYRGLSVRGAIPGLVAVLSILLPHSQPLRWVPIYGAVAVFATFGVVSLGSVHYYRNQKQLPYWTHIAQIVLSSLAICLGVIGSGALEGSLYFLFLLVVVVASSFRRSYLAQIGWLSANTALVVSALVVGPDPQYVLTLALNFAAVSGAVASVMVYFRNSLAIATERSSDLAYLAAVSARATTIRAAISEAGPTICRATGATEVRLAGERAKVVKVGDVWLDLGQTSRGPIHLALIGVTNPDETEMAAIADIFQPVVARDGVFADLQTLSQTDSLTGLANRRGLDEFLASHCVDNEDITWNDDPEAFGQRLDVTLVLLDLDHFKIYNDVNGHLAGDQVLRDLGKVLREGVRGTDLAARYGGEEFCLVLRGKPDGAAPLISRLREHWAAVHPDVKFSAGVAVWDRTEGPQALLARSDVALYASKEQGRNRTTLASALSI